MKRIRWWTLLSFAGVGLTAAVIGPSVWGQPGAKNGTLIPPIVTAPPEMPAAKPFGPSSLPLDTPGKGASEVKGVNPPPAFPVTGLPPISTQSSPAPQLAPKIGESVAHPTAKEPLDTALPEIRSGKQQPSVSLEWAGPTVARVNQPMACQLLVRNTSTVALQNVVVRQRLAQGVTCKVSDPPAANEIGELVWNLGTLAPEQTRRIDLQLVSQVRGTLNCQANVTFTGTAAHQVQVHEPQLAVKMRAPDKVVAGETVTLLFAVSNPGDGTAEAVRMKVLLPEGLEHPRGKVVEVDVGNLAPKEIRTMQLGCLANGAAMQKCLVVTTADGGISANDTVQFEILTPRLDAVVTGPKLRYVDRPAVYVVKVTNSGSAPVNNVEVQEVLPAGLKFHQANHGGKYQEATRTVSWLLGDLPPGQAREFSVDVIPTEAGEQRVLAQARSARGLKTEAEARTIVEGLPSLLIELADVDDPVEVGTETAYELHVTNTGTKTETNVEVTCTLPDQFEFKNAKCSTTLRYRVEGRQLIFEPLPRLAPKADVIYRIQVRGTAAADVRFRARIKADGLRDPILREESTRIYSDDSVVRPVSASPAPNLAPQIAPLPNPAPQAVPAPAPAPMATPNNGPAPGPLPLPDSVALPMPGPASSPLPALPPVTPVSLPIRDAGAVPLPLPMPGALPAPTPVPPPAPRP